MTEDQRPLSPPLPPDPAPQPAQATMTKMQQSQDAPRPADPPSERAAQSTRPPLPHVEQSDPSRVDSRRSAAATRRVTPVQPIQDAVSNAFHDSPATKSFDPDFIKMVTAQVTEEVMRNLALQQTATSAPGSLQPQQATSPRPQSPLSPSQESADFLRRQYTPPTPEQVRAEREYRDSGASSPERNASDAGSNVSRQSRQSVGGGRARDPPRPLRGDSSSTIRKISISNIGSPVQRTESFPRSESVSEKSPTEKRSSRKDSRGSDTSYDGASRSQVRPEVPPAEAEETTLERIWQPLFVRGDPTPRLGQFLRGLALHLIDDYEHKGSLVVTPPKMLRFFNEARVEYEHYPWDTIFGGKMTAASISQMYRKLLCEHHYVQNNPQEPPSVPCLTPLGFQCFMTCLIQAHPDTEFGRLSKAVMNMPISNAENKAERFPKELSRRLLPSDANIQAQQRLISSLSHEQSILSGLKVATTMPPPPPPAAPTSQPRDPSAFQERERQPYTNTFDDEDLAQAPVPPIERERKPYVAKEGAGKVYEESSSRPPPLSQFRSETSRPHSRSNSGLPPQAMYQTSTPSEPTSIPQRSTHRTSTSQGVPPPGLNGGYPKPVRGRASPPPRGQYGRNDDFQVGSMPNQPFGSNLYPTQSNPYPGDRDFNDEAYKRSRSKVERAAANSSANASDDNTSGGRGYPIPNANRGQSIANQSAYGYGAPGSMGGPLDEPGSSYPRRSMQPPLPVGALNDDNRRRSMFATPNPNVAQGGGDGGTDGYGSYASGTNGGYQQPYGSSPQQPPYGSSGPH